MNSLDTTSDQFEKPSHGWTHSLPSELSPSLLSIILDTNPAAWSLLSPTLTLSSTVANLLVFINAHLAGNYLNKVAVIASHCDTAQWLYPTSTEQRPPHRSPQHRQQKRQVGQQAQSQSQDLSDSTKRLRLSNGPPPAPQLNLKPPTSEGAGNKYRPFRLVEEELIKNLSTLLSSTTPDVVASSTSTMIAGALTLALSHINRESISYAESLIGASSGVDVHGVNNTSSTPEAATSTALQSRILLVAASPSTDLAHQYIPIMNAIFACQRLAIPIDVLQLPLPLPAPATKHPSTSSASPTPTDNSNSTVFLQQAADATKGIFIPVQLPKPAPSSPSSTSQASQASQALLTYLLTSFLPSPATRSSHLILPTRIDVDFRAACFCHRNVVSTGFVCSICLSIFCSVPENGDCLTCGTHLTLGNYGARPAVVARRRKARAR
ncbi:uncharacterized protein A1O9_08385 [Exophiala aquamarina CBS 119918]|uniref:General transcription and DNA repair factor IIH subunit TFB4 n=1 Tax=Exophiala aquamarina CBS 119918 TaxID=1182545 RepID=A0A072PJD2_9EURO|nr:uncharacterized protein A1O9_08385 [Exophiala aquamarina CBS 119918]KEF55635.1 hypothetical protein A1O9_08385 [Exophiala aquamarina CBS 119918]